MRYLLLLLLLPCFGVAYGQKKFVYVDGLGLFGKQLSTYPSISHSNYTLGFERIVRPRTGLNVAIGLGQTPIIIETSSFGVMNVETFTGARLNLALKFYTAREKSKRYGNGYGFFVGPYLGFMTVKHRLFTATTPQTTSSFIQTYSNTGIIGGGGLQLGYKFLIKQKYTVEFLVGWGWGHGSKFNSSGSLAGGGLIYSGNLILQQLNLGYRF